MPKRKQELPPEGALPLPGAPRRVVRPPSRNLEGESLPSSRGLSNGPPPPRGMVGMYSPRRRPPPLAPGYEMPIPSSASLVVRGSSLPPPVWNESPGTRRSVGAGGQHHSPLRRQRGALAALGDASVAAISALQNLLPRSSDDVQESDDFPAPFDDDAASVWVQHSPARQQITGIEMPAALPPSVRWPERHGQSTRGRTSLLLPFLPPDTPAPCPLETWLHSQSTVEPALSSPPYGSSCSRTLQPLNNQNNREPSLSSYDILPNHNDNDDEDTSQTSSLGGDLGSDGANGSDDPLTPYIEGAAITFETLPDDPELIAAAFASSELETGGFWPVNRILKNRPKIILTGPSSANRPVPMLDSQLQAQRMHQLSASLIDVARLELLSITDDARAPHGTYLLAQKWLSGMIESGLLQTGLQAGSRRQSILAPTSRRTFTSNLRKIFKIADPDVVTVPMETEDTRDLLNEETGEFPGPMIFLDDDPDASERSRAAARAASTSKARKINAERAALLNRFKRNTRDTVIVPVSSPLDAIVSLAESEIWQDEDKININHPTPDCSPEDRVAQKFFPPKRSDDGRLGECVYAEYFQSACRNLDIDPITDYVFYLALYMDKTPCDAYGRNGAEPLLVSLLNFKAEVRDDPRAWRLLGFIPDHELRSTSEKKRLKSGKFGQGVACRNYHRMLEVITERVRKELQEDLEKKPLFLDIQIGNHVARKRIVVVVGPILGDLKSTDMLTLRYSVHSRQIPRQMVGCYCPFHRLNRCDSRISDSGVPNKHFRPCVPVWAEHLQLVMERSLGRLLPLKACEDGAEGKDRENLQLLDGKLSMVDGFDFDEARRIEAAMEREEAGLPYAEDDDDISIDEDDLTQPSRAATLGAWERFILRVFTAAGVPLEFGSPPSYAVQDRINNHVARELNQIAPKDVRYMVKSLAQCMGRSAFRNLDTGGIPGGVHALAPGDPMHGFLLGLIRYIMDVIFQNLSPISLAKIDEIAHRVVRSQKQQDRAFYPRTDFSHGISKLTQLTAMEWLGKCFTMVIVLRSRGGQTVLKDNKPPPSYEELGNGKRRKLDPPDPLDWPKVLEKLEQLLTFHDLYVRGPFWKITKGADGARSMDEAIRTMLRGVISDFPRAEGNGWNLSKFHQLMRMASDMFCLGEPYGYDTVTGERLLKTYAKFLAHTAQQRGYNTFIRQMASRGKDLEAKEAAIVAWIPKDKRKPIGSILQVPPKGCQDQKTQWVGKSPTFSTPIMVMKVVVHVDGTCEWWAEGLATSAKGPLPFSESILTELVNSVAELAKVEIWKGNHQSIRPIAIHVQGFGECRTFPQHLECLRPVGARRCKRFRTICEQGLLLRAHPNYRSEGGYHDWCIHATKGTSPSEVSENFLMERRQEHHPPPPSLLQCESTLLSTVGKTVCPAQLVTLVRVCCNQPANNETQRDNLLRWDLDRLRESEVTFDCPMALVLPCSELLVEGSNRPSAITQRWSVACKESNNELPTTARLPVAEFSLPTEADEDQSKKNNNARGNRIGGVLGAEEQEARRKSTRVSRNRERQERQRRPTVIRPAYELITLESVMTRVLVYSEGYLFRDSYSTDESIEDEPVCPEVTLILDREQHWAREFKDFLDESSY